MPAPRPPWPTTSCGKWRCTESRHDRVGSLVRSVTDAVADSSPRHVGTGIRESGGRRMIATPSDAGVELLEESGQDRRRQAAVGLHAVRTVCGQLPAGVRDGVSAAKADSPGVVGESGQGPGQPVAVDVRRLLHVLASLSARHRVDGRPVAGAAGPGDAGGFSAAGGTPGDLPEPLQVRQRAGQIAAAAAGLGQRAGRAGAGSVQRSPAGGCPVAGGLLPVVLPAEPGRSRGPWRGS